MDKYEIAEKIEAALEDDYSVKNWEGGEYLRVYVGRTLSRGRRQDMGYIEINKDGSRDYCLKRQKAGIRDFVEAVFN